ncbi:MAG TPA: YceI family protein [Puia sp.]|nr:YceI family protein [Puia sp.]
MKKNKRLFLLASVMVTGALAITAFKPFPATLNRSLVTAIGATPATPATLADETSAKAATTNAPAQATTKWALDKVHSNVLFSVSHLVVSDVEGSFKSYDGTMENSKADYSDAKINFSTDVSSVSTDNENRDKHLKSDDFFNAEKFPKMTFVSSSFQPLGDNKYKLTGNLTIRDVTRTVTFDVKYGGSVNAMGGTHIGFKAKTTINRFDYNLKWDKTTEAGGMVVGKDVDITVNIDFKKV